MKPIELGAMRLMLPTDEEIPALFEGDIRAIEELPVLEPEHFALSGFEYARSRGLLRTPRVEFFVGVIPWFPPSFKKWCPVQLYWPEGKPDLAQATRIEKRGDLPLQVFCHIFHCFDCQIDADGFGLRLEAYAPTEYPDSPEVQRLLKPCPECGAVLKSPVVEVQRVWRPPE